MFQTPFGQPDFVASLRNSRENVGRRYRLAVDERGYFKRRERGERVTPVFAMSKGFDLDALVPQADFPTTGAYVVSDFYWEEGRRSPAGAMSRMPRCLMRGGVMADIMKELRCGLNHRINFGFCSEQIIKLSRLKFSNFLIPFERFFESLLQRPRAGVRRSSARYVDHNRVL
ncbi:hypothetical protein ASE61_02290 [Bosea sp. Root670]|nr:hypothetical protein ASE61_02290 [Bosea sp. Root670]